MMKICVNKFVTILSIQLLVLIGVFNGTETYGDDNITKKDLLGIWQQYSEIPWAMEFNENGTYRAAHTVLRLDREPKDEGRFQLEGTSLTLNSNDDCEGPCKGMIGTYKVELTEQGKLKLTEQKDQCAERVNDWCVHWTRVSP